MSHTKRRDLLKMAISVFRDSPRDGEKLLWDLMKDLQRENDVLHKESKPVPDRQAETELLKSRIHGLERELGDAKQSALSRETALLKRIRTLEIHHHECSERDSSDASIQCLLLQMFFAIERNCAENVLVALWSLFYDSIVLIYANRGTRAEARQHKRIVQALKHVFYQVLSPQQRKLLECRAKSFFAQQGLSL